jgi:hypothetical protein
MTKKTALILCSLLLFAGVLFFLPNATFDSIFSSSKETGLAAVSEVFGKVEKKGLTKSTLMNVSASSVIQSGDTFYTHADSKILFAFATPFWVMPYSKVELLKEKTGWVANLVYGDIKKLPTNPTSATALPIEILHSSQPIDTDTFSSYEFDPIDMDVKSEDLKEFSPDTGSPQNILEKQIFQTLGLHKSFFQGCLIKYYKKTKGNFASGETIFELTIDVTGAIEKAHIVRSDIVDEDYNKCLRTVLERIRFRNLPLSEPLIALFPLSVEMP